MSVNTDTTVSCPVCAAGNRGFSLVELIVVMGIFLTVMLITSSSFKYIANSTTQQTKAAETQISGVVGLEVFRADLEQAGFGLPWTYSAAIPPSDYKEAADPTYNDSGTSPPRAVVSGSNKAFGSYTGSKYIVIKSTVAATNATAKKWTSVSWSDGSRTLKSWNDTRRDLAGDDRVTVVKNNLITTPPTRQLMVSGGSFFTTFATYTALTIPHLDGDTFQIYGIDPDTDPDTPLGMPFNRADYYLGIPMKTSTVRDMPEFCAPNTGVLYKATINHDGGGKNTMPLLDCVADLQIVYGLDTSASGNVNFYTTAAPATAAEQRAQIKELRVYILTQEGKKDFTFSYPSQTVDVGESFDGGASLTGRRFDLKAVIGNDYKFYRWKVYTIVVRPKNLIQ